MAVTDSADVIVPEVWGDMAQADFVNSGRLLNSGAVVTSDQLVGNPGDTVHFPKWATLTDLSDLSEGTPIVPQEMGTTDSSATIKEAGTAVELTTRAQIVGIGNAQAEARRQFGLLAAKKVEDDLITAAQVAGAYTAGSTAAGMTWSDVVGAIATFGDEWSPADFAGLVIRSDAQAALFKDDQFIDAAKLGTNTAVLSGQIGVIGGVPVIVSDRLAAGKSLLLKKNSLGAFYKQRPIVEQDRDILARTDVLAITLHYAVKRLNDKGVCVLTAA